MKRLLAILVMVMTIGATTATVAGACRHRRYARRAYYARTYYPGYARACSRRALPAYYRYDHRTFWQKHRDKLTTLIGAGYGAGLGALIGGRHGAAIGALAGGGGAALYTYGIRRRHRDYRRY